MDALETFMADTAPLRAYAEAMDPAAQLHRHSQALAAAVPSCGAIPPASPRQFAAALAIINR